MFDSVDGFLKAYSLDVHRFDITPKFLFSNVVKKWTKFCISYDFEKNQAQAAVNGHVSEIVKDPKTRPNYNGTYDKTLLKNAGPDSKMILILGHYAFNRNPFIGDIANINVWDRSLNASELAKKTNCMETDLEQGSMINETSAWELTGTLVSKISVNPEYAKCTRKNQIYNAFLPIAQLTHEDATDLCQKLGKDVHIAGDFETVEDFDYFYDGLYRNQKYMDACNFYDSGRLRTWLPYKPNEMRTELVHVTTGVSLFKGKETFYTTWYAGPLTTLEPHGCTEAYFGLVKRYQNIREDPCSAKKCTACEIHNSHQLTSTLKLNGLCKLTFFDTKYTIHYDTEKILTYVGIEKSIIQYSFEEKLWTIKDMTNPYVLATSKAPFRSLAIGNFEWNVINDTECSQESYTAVLSLTSCATDEFTCDNGLCIPISER